MVQTPVPLFTQSTHQYDDIINLEYPFKSLDIRKHPRMSVLDRAKIFAPFAALTGYENAIKSKQKIIVPRIDLSEESKELLDEKLNQVERLLSQGQHPIVTVVYFLKEKSKEEGEYIQLSGMVAKLERTSKILQIVDKRIKLSDIYQINGENLD